MNSGVCIMLLPADAEGDEHVTLVYAGHIGAPTMTRYMAEQLASSLARYFPPPLTTVKSIEIFGPPDERVKVAELNTTPTLEALRSSVEMYSVSQFGFRPHIGVYGTEVRAPGSSVVLNRVALWWGDERMSWRFGTGERCAA